MCSKMMISVVFGMMFMLLVISSEVAARDLREGEVAKETNHVGDAKTIGLGGYFGIGPYGYIPRGYPGYYYPGGPDYGFGGFGYNPGFGYYPGFGYGTGVSPGVGVGVNPGIGFGSGGVFPGRG